ncbi:MAG: entericidin [Muribaculaceae bacterium]|nr:entericidin [Muribaculaceae bacterium]MBR1725861.1 entericidin [Muribaculaceae bacterium]
MKKLVLLLAVVFSVSLFSCTGNADQAAQAVDSAATEVVDTVAATVDSAATAAVDTAAAAVNEVVDSAKAAVEEVK